MYSYFIASTSLISVIMWPNFLGTIYVLCSMVDMGHFVVSCHILVFPTLPTVNLVDFIYI